MEVSAEPPSFAWPDSAGEAVVARHGFWEYRDRTERAHVASLWLADGLRQGQRAIYVADDPRRALIDDLADMPECDTRLQAGALIVARTDEWYDLSVPIDAAAQLQCYAAAVEQAARDGFRGVRTAVDITALVSDPARRAAHLRWEQVADRYLQEHRLLPLCLLDMRQADAIDAIDAIACCHERQGPHAARFSLYAVGRDRAALRGELDAAGHDALQAVLDAVPVSDRALDISALAFLDAHAAWLLHTHLLERAAAGQAITLVGAPAHVRRLWNACGFEMSMLRPAQNGTSLGPAEGA